MLNNDLIELANRQIQIACEEQQRSLNLKVRQIRADMAKRGMLSSSNHILAIQEAYADITKERGILAWDILLRCISTVGITFNESLETELKSVIESHLPEHMNGFQSEVNQFATQIGMPDIVSRLPDAIGDARKRTLRKIFSEIELFILKLKVKPVELPYTPQINIHNSSIGALQTGNESVANVNQKIDTEINKSLLEALINISEALRSMGSLPQNDIQEITELVNDGIQEIKKDNPNSSKLKAFVSTIGNAISFTADLKPAYESLKTAAIMIGLTLP